jgi:hypothetical protein
VVTPGEVLEDYLEFAGLTQASLAERTGLFPAIGVKTDSSPISTLRGFVK